MENSPWFHPAFLISAGVALIGLVSWFIRLESKTNANQLENDRLKKQVDELEDAIYKHLMDEKRHYNEQFFNEFRNTLDRRFQQLDNQLSGISGKLDRLSNK